MTSNLNNFGEEKKSDEILDDLKFSIEIIKLLDNTQRIRIILLLMIFQKLSLTDLSLLLGRSKMTVIYHIKKFDELGLLKITTKEGRGAIDANVYELESKFFNSIKFNIEQINDNNQQNVKNLLHHTLLKDILMFDLFIGIFELSKYYYKSIDELVNSDSLKEFQDKIFNSHINYDIWFLTEEGRKSYDKAVIQFKNQINDIVKRDIKSSNYLERPYCILHMLFPLQKIAKYDFKNKKFVDFLKIISNTE